MHTNDFSRYNFARNVQKMIFLVMHTKDLAHYVLFSNTRIIPFSSKEFKKTFTNNLNQNITEKIVQKIFFVVFKPFFCFQFLDSERYGPRLDLKTRRIVLLIFNV